MTKKVPVVAIVGRTNVGKSTLFNALARRRLAIVEDTPGVTRDRNYAFIKDEVLPYSIIDTGGLVGEEDEEQVKGMSDLVRAQAQLAIEESDVVLVVFDGLHGPHALDDEVVDHLRRSGKPVVWVINKCEKPLAEVLSAEFYALGLDEFSCISAAHRIGLEDLRKAIREKLLVDFAPTRPVIEDNVSQAQFDQSSVDGMNREAGSGEARPIRIAIVGKPNVGKSSLVNKILGQERIISADAPGTTRDCIDVELVREGQHFVLVDTAGLRKKARVEAMTLERFSNLRTLKALVGSDVAVLVLDSSEGVTDQDKKIAELIHERGRGLIIVANKWDLVEKDHRTAKGFEEAIYGELPFARYAPIIFVSALTGRRCPNILREAAKVYQGSQTRIPTGELNRLLERIFSLNAPPVVRGHPIKLFFATQISVAPPTILLFLNYPKDLQPSYVRYIKTHLRKTYPLEGVDIKLELRKRTEKQHSKGERKDSGYAGKMAAADEVEDSAEDMELDASA